MSSNLTIEKSSSNGRLSSGLGFAYATLGLRAGEARVDAIREAAKVSANSIQELSHEDERSIVTLADVATSTYRLLDPRKRVRKIERIQLSILSERALEMPQRARRPLVDCQQCNSAT